MTAPSNREQLAGSLAVYLVADPEQSQRPLESDIEDALTAGVKAVQIRAKNLCDRDFFDLGQRLQVICRRHGALFIVNDRIDIALALGADGVHLGVQDVPLAVARHLVGEKALLGFSPETDDQVSTAAEQGADYIGVGPVFATSSKDDAYNPIGVAGVMRLVALSTLPVVGIGGITPTSAGDVIAAGAVGVAVIGAILRAPSAGEAAAALLEAVHLAKEMSHR